MGVTFTERELDLMAVLWADGPSTAAEVRERLHERLGEALTHNTVLKLLTILEEKGHVGHTVEGRAHRFHALVAREAAGSTALRRLADTIFGGSAGALLSHYVHDRRLTRADLERARALLEARLASAAPPTRGGSRDEASAARRTSARQRGARRRGEEDAP